MKKLLRKLIILIVIVCIFLLIKKNTTRLGTSTQTWNLQTWAVVTWIDLTNCVSYFDGCNNCSVKDGKADACTLMYCEKPTEPKCLQYATWTDVTTGSMGIANPASVYCEQQSGTLEIVTDLSGWQSWMCHLSNGMVCEERAFYRGECKESDVLNSQSK